MTARKHIRLWRQELPPDATLYSAKSVNKKAVNLTSLKDNNNFQRTVLPNGMVLLSESIPHVRSVSVGVWVKTGSRHEGNSVCGVSHFIEHLLFKGTKNLNSKEIAFKIDSLGGNLDAFTSREYTCYYSRVMDENFEQAVELLADLILNPTFDKKEMDVERQVILEEIRTTDDTPDELVHDVFMEKICPDHPLGRPILGTNDIIVNLSREQLLKYFENNYFSDNIIISAAGNLKHQQFVDLINKYLKTIRTAPPVLPQITAPTIKKHITTLSKDLEQAHLCLGSRGIPYTHKLRYSVYLLNTLFGGGMSSRLFQKIREERGLVYTIYSYCTSYHDMGVFTIYAGTGPEKMQEVVDLILQEIKQIKENPIGEDELKKSKDQLKGSLTLSHESVTTRMSTLAKHEIYFKNHFTLDEILDSINAVRVENVQELASYIFDDEFISLALLGPPGTKKPII